jgi:hypothetical protein
MPKRNAGALAELHASLDARRRPEEVAGLIVTAVGDDLSETARLLVARAAASRVWWSSMPEDFARPVGGHDQLTAVSTLIGGLDDLGSLDPDDPADLRRVVETVGRPLGYGPGADFKRDRRNRAQRAAVGIDVPKRQYNRRWRALSRLAAKAATLETERAKRSLLLVGRSRFAGDITRDRFKADPVTGSFVAYYTAKRNVRRGFTLSGRDNPYDEVAAALFAECLANPATDWWMVSRVYQEPQVLARLSDADRGELLGRWSAVMRQAAELLERVWQASNLNRTAMVVRRGNDSSTWNTVATAYNTARAGWITALHASGAADLLDVACPGKVLRLMAADLAWWHTRSGGELDPDTKVWSELPLPWEVLSGQAVCTRAHVEAICQRAGIDPAARGWTAPRATGGVGVFRPTPELVHGVAVADPVWASMLRRAGVFSGHGGRRFDTAKLPPADMPADVVVGELPDWTTLPQVGGTPEAGVRE